ncbi:hypothetical protein HA402_012858 [Bradysia odoriphaga]|nr:hypothetical protein HA402_012858 [Bradysia odoriphaga]
MAIYCGSLPTAHCIQKKNSDAILSPHDLVVLLGAYNITSTDQKGTVTSNVTETYVHPEWDPYDKRFDADLAILVLDHAITFTKHIRPICMPTDSTDINGATIDITISGTMVGWGILENTNIWSIFPDKPQ